MEGELEGDNMESQTKTVRMQRRVLLAFIALVGASACGGSGPGESAGTSEPAEGTLSCGGLGSGEVLFRGQSVGSCNGRAFLTHQGDGNVVVYDRVGPLWSTNTWGSDTSAFLMQTDGNLVLYAGNGQPLWWSGTYGNPGARLAMQDDCNLVIYNTAGNPIWATMTFCR
ncbi:peptidase S8 [Cystobacter fuscus]|uniref:Peptidase S8 n=1 Tax=Cystobacter fuscus TaxID=43 RepID=A0A250ISN6_9BACT|nr:peptidase S8 [Cystobacter fuscus]